MTHSLSCRQQWPFVGDSCGANGIIALVVMDVLPWIRAAEVDCLEGEADWCLSEWAWQLPVFLGMTAFLLACTIFGIGPRGQLDGEAQSRR